ncbi:type IV pili methyl-accepting chemotaxis transducer N-terminal domain-containing protein [Rhodovulum sp. DZ06]|uniref:type IV pili methyl-accepting chemotaxis transducer N-terminal domain-containing protein n=1 Tax=Rhodovulum sp. DZ06 TaxID=3425126 RepID=UPI003D357904
MTDLTSKPTALRLARRDVIAGGAALALSAPAAHAAKVIIKEAPDPAQAAADAQAAKRKINLAGRQRMLSQRMAKAAAFVRLGIEPERHLEMMKGAYELFDVTLKGLHHGNADQGLTPEGDAKVVEALNVVEGLWYGYGAAVKHAIESGAVTEADMDAIARLNGPVLVTMNAAVKEFETAYGNNSISLGLAIAINVSGRQRMLSQKMSKEVALCALGMNPEETKEALANTIRLFDLSLTALIDGLPTVSIIKPPTEEVDAKLREVRALWTSFKPVVDSVAASGQPTLGELAKVAAQNDPLLKTMNEAVFLYENA